MASVLINILLKTIRVKCYLTNSDKIIGRERLCFITERHFTNITDLIFVTVIFRANYSTVLIFNKLFLYSIPTNCADKTSRVIQWITGTQHIWSRSVLDIFSCEGAALEVLMYVRPSVRLCVIKLKISSFWRYLKVPEGFWRFLKVPEGSGMVQGRFRSI